MAIEKILRDIAVEEFIDRYYLKLPYSQPQGAEEFTDLASWKTLEKILKKPEADVRVVREGRDWEGNRPTCEEAGDLYSQGYTFSVRHAEKHDRGLARLARSFRKDFRAPIDIHLYFTPCDSFGFDWHYDAEEVFILQAQGVKEYSLRKNTVNPWPLEETLPADMEYEKEVMPVMSCRLNPGDWLYLPAGYWHKGIARADSISIAVGIMAPSAIRIFDVVKNQLLKSLLWRQRLPLLGEIEGIQHGEVMSHIRSLLADLEEEVGRVLRDERFLKEFLAAHEELFKTEETHPG
jgi:ribosomal protein L16 Arg81 hydroxylase